MLLEARYDEYGVPLCRSNVGEHIWALYHSKPVEFKRKVLVHYERGMSGWTVDSVNYKHRTIWLKDDRGRNV
jgi:hypothetical protein